MKVSIDKNGDVEIDDAKKKLIFHLALAIQNVTENMKKRSDIRNKLVFGNITEEWDRERELENVDFLDEKIEDSFKKITTFMKDIYGEI